MLLSRWAEWDFACKSKAPIRVKKSRSQSDEGNSVKNGTPEWYRNTRSDKKRLASEVTHSGTLLKNEESSFLKSGADKMFLESLVSQ